MTVCSSLIPSSALLIVGALLGTPWQVWCWLAAIAFEPLATYVTSRDVDWRVHSAAHFTERYGLVVILALGESIIAIGVGVGSEPISLLILLGVLLAILISAGMWWAYFSRLAHRAEDVLGHLRSARRARVVTDGYTYVHLVLVAGIVSAALGVEVAMAHIGDLAPFGGFGAAALGGGVACYLAGTGVFTRRVIGEWPVLRFAGATLVLAATRPLAWSRRSSPSRPSPGSSRQSSSSSISPAVVRSTSTAHARSRGRSGRAPDVQEAGDVRGEAVRDLDEGHVPDVEVHLQTAPWDRLLRGEVVAERDMPIAVATHEERAHLEPREVGLAGEVADRPGCTLDVLGSRPGDHVQQRGEVVVGGWGAERGDGERPLLVGRGMREHLEGRLVGQEVQAARGGGRHQHDAAEAGRLIERGLEDRRPAEAVPDGDRVDQAERVAERDHVVGVLVDRASGPRRGAGARPAPDEVEGGHAGVLQVQPADERVPRRVVVLKAVDGDHVAPGARLEDGELGVTHTKSFDRPPQRRTATVGSERITSHGDEYRLSSPNAGSRRRWSRRATASGSWPGTSSGRSKVRSFAVAVEDGEDLGGRPMAEDPVRRHGVELGGLAGLDEVLAFAEQEAYGARRGRRTSRVRDGPGAGAAAWTPGGASWPRSVPTDRRGG